MTEKVKKNPDTGTDTQEGMTKAGLGNVMVVLSNKLYKKIHYKGGLEVLFHNWPLINYAGQKLEELLSRYWQEKNDFGKGASTPEVIFLDTKENWIPEANVLSEYVQFLAETVESTYFDHHRVFSMNVYFVIGPDDELTNIYVRILVDRHSDFGGHIIYKLPFDNVEIVRLKENEEHFSNFDNTWKEALKRVFQHMLAKNLKEVCDKAKNELAKSWKYSLGKAIKAYVLAKLMKHFYPVEPTNP